MTDFSLEKAAMAVRLRRRMRLRRGGGRAADGAGIRSGGDPAGGRLHPRP